MLVACLRRLSLIRSELSLRMFEAFAPQRCLAAIDPRQIEGDEINEDVFSLSRWFFAAPKKRVSKMRKRRKLVRWKLKPITHLYDCHFCGKPRMRHKLSKCCIEYGVEHTRIQKEMAATKIMAEQQLSSMQDKPRSLD